MNTKNHINKSFSCAVVFDDLIKNECYFDYLGALVILLDAKGFVRIFNTQAELLTGYTKEEVLGKNWVRKFVSKRSKTEVRSMFKNIVAGGIDVLENFINPIYRRDYSEVTISWSNRIVLDSKGKRMGILSTGVNVTDLFAERDRIEAIVNSLQEGIVIHKPSGEIIFYSKPFKAFVAKSSSKLLGEDIFKLFSSSTLENGSITARDAFSKKDFYFSIKTFSVSRGESVVEVSNSAISYQSEEAILSVVRDVTDQYKNEEKLLIKNQELENLNRLMVGRELKMIELKSLIRDLREKLDG